MGYSLAKNRAASATSLRLYVEGLDCAEEINLIKKTLAHQPGIKELKFFLITREVEVYFDPEKIQEKEIISGINKLGLKAEPVEERGEVGRKKAEDIGHRNRRLLVLTAIAGALTLLGIFLAWLGMKEEISLAIYLLAILMGGTHIARKGLAAARHLSLDMNFLMTIAVVGAAFIGEWVEAAAVVFLFSLAHLLENYSLDRARRAIHSLMDLATQKALVRRKGQEIEVDVATIQLGEQVIVRPGVNDAPALAMATTGIAMGTAGTDAALETADIALMKDNLLGLPLVVQLGKKTLKIIKQNITLALLIKFIFFALTLPGLATLWMAVFADMGASFIVIFNGLRLLRFKNKLLDRASLGK